MKLTAVAIGKITPKDKPYTIADGRGLQLLIYPNGSKYWRLKYRINGKQPTFAVGVYCGPSEYDAKGQLKKDKIITGLAEARTIAVEARTLVAAGVDPNEAKKQARAQPLIDESNTFAAVAREWHGKSGARWSADHSARILRRLTMDLFPQIGHRAVADLKTKELLQVLRSVEERGHLDVAGRLRQYLTAIMRYAVQTDRIDSNPATDLQGALTVVKSTHHPALSLERLPELLGRMDTFAGRMLTKSALVGVRQRADGHRPTGGKLYRQRSELIRMDKKFIRMGKILLRRMLISTMAGNGRNLIGGAIVSERMMPI